MTEIVRGFYDSTMGNKHSFHSTGEIVQNVAKRFGLENNLLEIHLKQHWARIAGRQVAAHTQPDQIRFKKLFIVVESSAWAHHLTFLKPTLIEKISAEAGRPCITDIVVRVGHPAQNPVEPERNPDIENEVRQEEWEVSPESLEEAAEHTQQVKDPELQMQLTMIMAKALSLKKPPQE